MVPSWRGTRLSGRTSELVKRTLPLAKTVPWSKAYTKACLQPGLSYHHFIGSGRMGNEAPSPRRACLALAKVMASPAAETAKSWMPYPLEADGRWLHLALSTLRRT